MTVPGFTAEPLLSGRSMAHITKPSSNLGDKRRVIPALPIGGWAQLGLSEERTADSEEHEVCASRLPALSAPT